MKAEDLTDMTMRHPKASVVIELPNGQRLSTDNYSFDYDANVKGQTILVIRANKKLTKVKPL